MDNFERAAENKNASPEDYMKGIDMIYNQFSEVFKKLGVESFDENEKENVITDVFSKGYKLGDKILRPAMVKVAN